MYVTSRDLETRYFDDNPLLRWGEEASFLKTALNIIVSTVSKPMPLKIKNFLLRRIGVSIDRYVAIALSVQVDIFYPEKISIGEGSVIGYNSTLLTHEATPERFSTGEVRIGEDVLVGANTTVLPGVEIGDGAKISANSLVDRDVDPGEKVQGVPIETVN